MNMRSIGSSVVTVLYAILGGMLLQTASAADLGSLRDFDIKPQRLETALIEFSRQADLQVIGATETLGDIQTQGVSGRLTNSEALNTLLQGTALGYAAVGEHSVRIVRVSRETTGAQRTSAADPRSTPTDLTADPNTGASTPVVLEEIIVTAQKREERLQDVPVPVTAISAQTLVDSNQVRLQDYYTMVPGLSVAPSAQSQQLVAIRGITTGLTTNPTVGVLVDDVPFGSSTGTGGGFIVPDVDPGDLARVEVLRGPQGTLYGASSMGGLLKFVTLDPSTTSFSGRVQAGIDGVQHGDATGYSFRGSVNVPLTDTLAFRASGFTREDPGYIENVSTGERGVNEARASGGRLAVLWSPSASFKVKLSALYQEIRSNGGSYIEMPTAGYPQTALLGNFQQNDLPGAGGYDRQVQAYSATITGRLGNVEIVAVSGYNINSIKDSYDFSFLYGPLNTFGVPGAAIADRNATRKFTQEIRLSGSLAARIDWLVGGFYTHEASPYDQNTLAVDPSSGQVAGTILSSGFPTTFAEYAGFADLTYHFTDRFDVQVGGRESRLDESYTSVTEGPLLADFGLASPSIIPETHSHEDAFTYLVTPRLKITPDLMVYARAASGYRAGGPNTGIGVPPQYSPDKTNNFELGTKADFLQHTLSIDSSVYYIDWQDIQLQAVAGNGFGYLANAGSAKSEGVEFSLQAKPTTSLTASAWVAWNDAQLTKPFPVGSGTYGADGDRLPYADRWSGSVSLQQDFPIRHDMTGFAGGSMSYVGNREGEFTATPQRQLYGGYAKADLRAGVNCDTWTVTAYVTNLLDRRGLLSGGLGTTIPFSFYEIQPRSAGLSVTKRF